MTKHSALVLIAALALLGGCSAPATAPTSSTPAPATSSAAASPSGTSASATPTPTPTRTEPTTTENGHVAKKIGEWAELRDGNGETAARFRVTKIDPRFRCTSGYSEKPENGHYVAIWMEIKTTKVIDFESDDSNVVPYFNTTDWVAINSDGVSENDTEGNGYSCARDSDSLPTQLSRSKSVKGVVVVDIKTRKGSLALVQDYMDTGWEWQIPS